MYYGDEKALQMSRSILPSTRRKSAREEKKNINRRKRRIVKQALHKINCEEDWDEDNLSFDYWYDANHERSYMVRDRRGADKIGPFMRWAEVKAKYIPDGEKLEYIRSILPGTGFIVIDHALSHLEHLDGFDRDVYRYGSRSWYRGREYHTVDRNELIRILGEVTQDRNAHAALNEAIRRFHKKTYWYRYDYTRNSLEYNGKVDKEGRRLYENVPKEVYRAHDKTTGPRVFEGIHDIDKFIDDISRASWVDKTISAVGDFCGSSGSSEMANPEYHPEWKFAVKLFVDCWVNNPSDHVTMRSIERNENYTYNSWHPKRKQEIRQRKTVIQHTKWNW